MQKQRVCEKITEVEYKVHRRLPICLTDRAGISIQEELHSSELAGIFGGRKKRRQNDEVHVE